MCLTGIYQLLHNKGLKQLNSHFLRYTALVNLKLRPYYDNGTTGIVNTLSEEVLTETALLTL